MIKENYYNIVNGLDVKENLLELKEALKNPIKGSREKDALLLILKDDVSVLTALLKNEDPKIRKNSAIVLGELGLKETLDPLFEGYMSDEIMYNKAAYLEAIRKIDYTPYLPQLEERFKALKNTSVNDENKKHILDEMKVFKKIFGTGKAEFVGFGLKNELILTTNRYFTNITEELLGDISHKSFNAGVIVKTDNLRSVLPIRTYDELLFIPDNIKTVDKDPVKAAKELIEAGISDYIFARIGVKGEKGKNKEGSTVNFRAELKVKDKERAHEFTKKFASELETLSHWKLSNSVSDYNLEFRFIENSKGSLNVLLKFTLLKDVRFTYRRETIAAGIKPYLAATIMQLAAPYLNSNSVVLDPFCGVGTFLAEHEPVSNAKMYYGIDIFGEAVEKARINLKSAGILKKTELINKDFFEFIHSYKFDEIITDMPFVTDRKTLSDIENIYREFFCKCDSLLEKKGVMVIYSRNPEFVKKYYTESGCSIEEDFEISRYENSHLFILKR